MTSGDALSAKERTLLATVIRDERARVLRQLAGLERVFDDLVAAADLEPPDDEHDPDGTTAYERAQVSSLAIAARARVAELDRALAALSQAEADPSLASGPAIPYGVCERCGTQIGFERLQAMPGTARCVQCAARG